jgi:hypothetical protein
MFSPPKKKDDRKVLRYGAGPVTSSEQPPGAASRMPPRKGSFTLLTQTLGSLGESLGGFVAPLKPPTSPQQPPTSPKKLLFGFDNGVDVRSRRR